MRMNARPVRFQRIIFCQLIGPSRAEHGAGCGSSAARYGSGRVFSQAVGRAAITAATTCIFVAFPLRAQVVTGRVLDAITSEPVPAARVLGVGALDSVFVLTNDVGRYRIALPAAGSYRLRVQRLGYAAGETEIFKVEAGEELKLNVRLAPQGVELAAITVEGRGGFEPGRFAFERRCGLGKGLCLTADSIRKREPRAATDVFRAVDGLKTIYNPADMFEPQIGSILGYGCFLVFVNNSHLPSKHYYSAGQKAQRLEASPNSGHVGVMSSGGRRLALGGVGINALIDPDAIVGVEIYRGYDEVPRELLQTQRAFEIWNDRPGGKAFDHACGLAIIWTRAAW